MLIAVLMLFQVAAEAPRITITESLNGYRAEAATFDVAQEQAIKAEIEQRAADLCQGKQIKWGKFGSLARIGKDPAKGPPTISGYFNEFSCVAPQTRAFSPVPPTWTPAPTDETDARRTFETYYGWRDAGQFEAAAAMFQPEARERPSFEEQRIFNRTLGLGSGKRRISGVTWYVDPPSAPHPGVYVALDFIGDYPALHVYCGYIVLYRNGPGSYEITREEQNMFARGAGNADPDQIARMRASLCRGS
ncbi:MAG: hypothetical protein H0T82_06190 [Sphingomonas sp.]|nr:hypothetical protein [Sphingomonas sp.]